MVLPSFLQALQQPACFPHPVHGFEVIETHISWVLLTGEYAYKFKKPVALGFVDFSTLALRHQACLDELRLNRRLAPDLYLEVVALTGTPATPRLEAGEPFEYAVKMRQFDRKASFDHLIRHQELLPVHLDALAELLARFHLNLPAAPPDSPWGLPAQILAAALDNLRPLPDKLSSAALAELELDELRATLVRTHEQLAPRMQQRRTEGFIRECHGDLHLGNLVLIDGWPMPFDCIEFNPELRWIDLQNEIAFLYMDLLAHDAAGLARVFLNRYLEVSGDYAGLPLLRFYAGYRAMVRLKVAVLQQAAEPDQRIELPAPARPYAHVLAQLRPARPFALLTHGVSGSGKTYGTQVLVEAWDVIRLRADVERKRLFGLTAQARPTAEQTRQLYADSATVRTYAHLAELSRLLLQAGWPIIIDATFLTATQRRRFTDLFRQMQVSWAILDFQAPAEVLRARVEARRRRADDASDADLAVLAQQLERVEPLQPDEQAQTVSIDTTQVDYPANLPARLRQRLDLN